MNTKYTIKIYKYLKKSNYKNKQKLKDLLTKFPQRNINKINYLIAGSWAIELISDKKLKHTDIDILSLQNPPIYFDDAKIKKEQCNGPIPIPLNYFKKNYLIIRYNNTTIYTPTINFQICVKLIGELNKNYSQRAINQTKLLINKINLKNINKKEINYIYKKLIPEKLNYTEITNETIKLILDYKKNKNDKKFEKDIKKIHKKINEELKYEFKKLKK